MLSCNKGIVHDWQSILFQLILLRKIHYLKEMNIINSFWECFQYIKHYCLYFQNLFYCLHYCISFLTANIRVFCETIKFLEEFLILVLMSHRSHGFFSLQQRFVYHQDSVSTILLVVTPISFEKSYIWFLIAVSLWTYRFFNHHVFLRNRLSICLSYV